MGEDVRTVPGPTPAMIAKGLEAILVIGEFALKQEKNKFWDVYGK